MLFGVRGCAATAAAIVMTFASAAAMAVPGDRAPAFGPAAPAGGGPCSACFAVVDATGALLRGRGVARIVHLGGGVYDVFFRRQVGACAWLATLGPGTFGGVAVDGEVSVTGLAGTNNAIFVTVFDSTGASVDRPFHLMVAC